MSHRSDGTVGRRSGRGLGVTALEVLGVLSLGEDALSSCEDDGSNLERSFCHRLARSESTSE